MRLLGNAIQKIFASWTITDPLGWVWGTATGGAKGAGTINAQGVFVNGTAVLTSAAGITSQVVTSGGNTSRTSTTTMTIDANLQIAVAAAGTYKIEIFAPSVSGMTATFGGMQAMIGLSANNGSGAGTAFMVGADGSNPSINSLGQGINVSSTITVTNSAFFGPAAYSSTVGLMVSACVVLSAATTVGLYWAQGSSNATATTILAGATMIITKVA